MRVSIAALLRLLASLARERTKGADTRDPGRVICDWARALTGPDNRTDLEIPVLHRTLVGDPEHSARILAAEPSRATYCAGATKVDGMKFLAPAGLTIADGDRWRRLRTFNEEVLAAGTPHPDAQTFLTHIRAAFSAPVKNQDDISRAMGRAMVGIVFGDSATPNSDPGADVRELFGLVAGAAKRKAVGRFYKSKRERFYAKLRQRWEKCDRA